MNVLIMVFVFAVQRPLLATGIATFYYVRVNKRRCYIARAKAE